MPGSVRVVDRGANDLLRRLREAAAGYHVKVGVIGAEAAADHGGMTNADIASYHEFGLGVPQRSFIREWADENEGQNKAKLRRAGREILKNKSTVQTELERFGVEAVGSIQQRMASGPSSWKPLAEATVRRKTGRSGDRTARLIDTGQLRSSITHEVVQGKPEGGVA